MTDLTALGVVELSKQMADRSVSSGEVLRTHLDKIGADGPPSFDGRPDAVNAWARLYEEEAIAAAERADARLAGPEPVPRCVVALPSGLGSRSGLPVGVSLVGAPGAEWRLLDLGIELQSELGVPRP